MERNHMTDLYASSSKIKTAITYLADSIGPFIEKADGPVCFVGNLNGSIFFLVDLLRKITDLYPDLDFTYDFIQTSAYKDNFFATENTVPILKKPQKENLVGHHVILIDEIIDSGVSAKAAMDWIEKETEGGCLSISVCALIDRFCGRKVPVETRWRGWKTDTDKFLFGYGLDLKGRYRTLLDIWEVERMQ